MAEPGSSLAMDGTDREPGRHLAPAKSSGTLIIDERCEWLLEASPSVRGLAGAIARPDGRLHGAIRLATQVARLGALSGTARYVRLRLDPRGVAAPMTCRLTQTCGADGARVIVIGVPGMLPGQRSPMLAVPAAEPDEPGPSLDDAPAPAARPRTDRLVWRSDAEGRLTSIDGGDPGVVATLRGRLWSSFPDGGVEILAHLRDRRTFRGLPVTIREDETGVPIALTVSGAPLLRNAPTGGDWTGFATARRLPIEESSAENLEPPIPDPAIDEAEQADAVDLPNEAASAPAFTVEGVEHRPPEPADASLADLLSHEREAFREIARTLGALLNEGDPVRAIPSAGRGEFSGAAEDAVAAILENLPAGVLVFRDAEILYANRRFSDLLGGPGPGPSPGSASMAPGALLPMLPAASQGERLVEMSGDGHKVRMLVERSSIEWDGEPAALVLARAAPAVAHWFEPSPTEAAGTFAAVTHAPAMLGRSGQGRGAIDPRGRILVIKTASHTTATQEDGAPEKQTESVRDPKREPVAHPRCGAVVPLRARVERLLTLDTLEPDSGDPDVREESAVAEPRPASEEAARSRFAFFTKIGRAIRASLGTIRGSADTLLADASGPSSAMTARDRLRDIRAASEEASSLLDGLLAWTLVASGRTGHERQTARLNDVVVDCIAEQQAQAVGGRVLLRSSLSSDMSTLKLDERSLRRATRNAIAHAIEQSQPGGQVIVSTTIAERGEAVLRVRSTGFEMSPDTIEQALDPFAGPQAQGSDTGQAAGRDAGRGVLGLTLAKALVEVNGGRLAIASRAGEGTLVELGFPADAA